MSLRLLGWTAALCAVSGCGSGRLQHDDSMQFGDVAVGQSRTVALQLMHQGAEPQAMTFETASAEFTLEEDERTLGPNETTTLFVRFSPGDLGERKGRLTIRSALGVPTLSLSGRGTGPRLSVPSPVTLAPFAIVSGEGASTSSLVLRNTGTAGSLLQLELPRVDGPELCVGTFVGAVCQAWVPPQSLDTQTLLEVPLSLFALTPGPRRWSVVFPSNAKEVTIEVVALVEAFEPCVFLAPERVSLLTSSSELRVKHTGPGTCLIREASVTSSPAGFLSFAEQPSLPMRLESGASFMSEIVLGPSAPRALSGVARIVAAGTPALNIPVRREMPMSSCLAITPSPLDFGTVAPSCSSPTRNVHLYNFCATPITLADVRVTAGAGEPPGSLNCPGSAPCPEFFIVQGFSPGTVVQPGSTPVSIGLKYVPSNVGADTGVVTITTREDGELNLELQGRGESLGAVVDRFRNEPLPVIDLLVTVDASPSFVPKRAGVRANLIPLLTFLGNGCHDARCGFAAADGAPGAGVRLLTNDAGAQWTSTSDPLFVQRALSAFDQLPVGSELEACVGPAADLIADAGTRAESFLSAVCITDALEQTPTPAAALQRLEGQVGPGRFSWSAVTGVGAACSVEAIDDGVHANLVTASHGARGDICDATWGQSLLPLSGRACGSRTTYYLSLRPAGPLGVRIDGQLVPNSDWTLDVASNAVVFVPGRQPAPGTTLEISYGAACIP